MAVELQGYGIHLKPLGFDSGLGGGAGQAVGFGTNVFLGVLGWVLEGSARGAGPRASHGADWAVHFWKNGHARYIARKPFRQVGAYYW